MREYPNAIASNVLGYVSEVNKNDMKKDDYYSLGEQTGRQGIERYYEHLLRGVKGKRFYKKIDLIESSARMRGESLIFPQRVQKI